MMVLESAVLSGVWILWLRQWIRRRIYNNITLSWASDLRLWIDRGHTHSWTHTILLGRSPLIRKYLRSILVLCHVVRVLGEHACRVLRGKCDVLILGVQLVLLYHLLLHHLLLHHLLLHHLLLLMLHRVGGRSIRIHCHFRILYYRLAELDKSWVCHWDVHACNLLLHFLTRVRINHFLAQWYFLLLYIRTVKCGN